jgi:hypothetical protein
MILTDPNREEKPVSTAQPQGQPSKMRPLQPVSLEEAKERGIPLQTI